MPHHPHTAVVFFSVVLGSALKSAHLHGREAHGAAREIIGPTFMPTVAYFRSPSVPRGKLHNFVMRSQESSIYPGIRRDETTRVGTEVHPVLPNMTCAITGTKLFNAQQSSPPQSLPGVAPYEREVAVYVPEQLPPDAVSPFLVVNDGMGSVHVVTPVLDALIAAKQLPAMVVVFVNSGGSDAQGSQRGLEYDTMSGLFASFVDTEVLPRVEREAGVRLTRDPSDRAVMGMSSGGAAAFSMAWYRPDIFRRVLSYSGTFVDQQWPFNTSTPHGCWDYHSGKNLIRNSPRKALRVWLAVSEFDMGALLPTESFHAWPLANERMADALEEKGYAYHYVFARGASHCDLRVQTQTLPGALKWLWADYGQVSRSGTSYQPM